MKIIETFEWKYVYGTLALVVFAGWVFFSSVSVVRAAALNYNADTTVTLTSPAITLTIPYSSAATSLIVNAGSIVVTVPTGSVFTVKSPSRDLTVTGATADAIITTACFGGVKEITVNAENVSIQTLTITPTGSQCSPPAGAGGGGGGSSTGGGTGGTYTTSPAQTTTTVATTTQSSVTVATTSTPDIKAQLAILLERLAALRTQAKIVTGGTAPLVSAGQIPKEAIPATGIYKKSLSLGTISSDVSALQALLKALGQGIYPEGIVSGYFGALTKRAVGRFQMAYDIAKEGDPGFGFVGPKTRAKLNILLVK